MKQNIFTQIVFVTTFFLGVTACTPNKMNKVVVDQADSTVEIQRDSAGATSVRVTPRESSNQVKATSTTETDQTLSINSAQRELTGLDTQLASVRQQLAVATKERNEAIDARTKAVADVDHARLSVAALHHQIEQLGADKAAMEKDLTDLTDRRDEVRVEVVETQHATDALTAEIARLDAERTAINQELASLTANLDDLRSQIETRKHDLADLAAQAAEPGGNTTTSATGSVTTMPAVDNPGDELAVSPAVPIVGGIVAIIVAAAVTASYLTRKPLVYAFTLLDDGSKVSHRIQMTSGERVDLNGGQPVKKVGIAKNRAPFITIDRKGRLALHPMTGFAAKLNDQFVSTADTPVVKPGNVLEIATNGQVSRFVVGPVSTVTQNQKPSVAATSVRPA